MKIFDSDLTHLMLLTTAAVACCLLPAGLEASPVITYVQSNYATPQSPQTAVSVVYAAGQVSGDLNIVVVGWNDSTAAVSAVTDSEGNPYTLAVGPTVQSGFASQSIYYAPNILSAPAGTNTVTVTFASAATNPDIRIFEYSGADSVSPVDATAANLGNSTTSISGLVNTTNATDLIFGASLVQTATIGPGGGFTQRLLTAPDGDIVEDQMVAAAGSYSASAPLDPSGPWIMQAVAFRTPAITYVQGNYATPQTPQTTVNVAYVAGQAAGDLNVVVVGWNDSTAVVSGVTDSSGNTYTLAVGPTVQSGFGSQSVYYAPNILTAAAGTNTVTVTFARPATFPDVRILEYSGADPINPVDATGANSGNSTISISGSVSTTNATDLIFGANLVQTGTIGPGGGFTQRLLTAPDGDIVEDQMVAVPGSYSASAPLSPPGSWIMQTVAFRTPSGGTTPPTVSSGSPSGVAPNSGPTAGGTAVTITGTNFATGATVAFGGMAATNVVVVSGTEITATTPLGSAGAATVTVTNPGAQSGSLANGFTYAAPTTPAISYVQDNSAALQPTQTTVNVAYAGAQVAGDLNIIVVGWNDNTAVVSAVTDSSGNEYALAVGPTIESGFGSQSIYYAPNIASAAAGTNTVTVTFASAAASPDIRILEYSGADPINPVDVTAANSGNSTTSDSGSASTTNATDLIFGANLSQAATIAPGVGFTQRLLSMPDGNVLEDQMVAATGSYNASASLGASAPWIMQMVAFRTPGGNPAPTVPGNLTATAAGASQINLSWTASTSGIGIADYVVQRCQGAGCTSFAQIATGAWTNYSDTGLLPSTSYTYQVQAFDTAGNTSAFSSTATAATLAPPPPTAPGSLTAVAASLSQINLSWTASTGSVGIADYVVQRCQGVGCTSFAQIATLAGTVYNDTGLLSSTSYSYRVQSVDTTGNTSGFSNLATAATLAPPPPTTPGNLTATAASASQINLNWTASTSSNGIADYVVQRCQGAGCVNFAQIATPAGTSYSDTGLSAGTSYSYQVQAVDAVGNVSTFSNIATIATQAPQPSTAPGAVTAPSPTTGFLLPLKASSNNRYLVGQDGTPFFIMGDAPQALVGNLSPSDMATYMANREQLGFNTLWVNLLCASYTFCNSDGTTYDGVAPFMSGSGPSDYDLSTPNSAYFSRVDNMLNLALTYNLVVFLDPIETGGWLVTLENNGSTNAHNYGVYVGNRYKSFTNIVWLHGNDFQTWSSSSTDNNLVGQVMAGIASVDSNHLQTVELNYDSSYSNQDSALGSVLTLDSAYTYYETYDMVLQSYNSSPAIPTYLVESNYEYENNTGGLPSSAGPYVLREQAYWTMLSGGAGQIYGNHYTVSFMAGWQSYLNSPGGLEIQYINQLFGSVAWWELTPDSAHEVVTAGYGAYNGSNQNLTTSTYCTTSWITSGSLALTYCPNPTTLTVDLAQFSGQVTAQWYDPSNGAYSTVPGSPFANSGTQYFTTPGNNHDGDPDWVLVLKSAS
jgi:fibronectin type 3 domain-containing protein